MLLSEAIGLGSLLGEPTNANTYCGCALSMGLRATGLHEGLPVELDYGQVTALFSAASDAWWKAEMKVWPWLHEERPCPYWVETRHVVHPPLPDRPADHIISDMFDMVQRGRATLDELIEWVRENEPAESTVAESCTQSELVVT